jgi:hypothetical protein
MDFYIGMRFNSQVDYQLTEGFDVLSTRVFPGPSMGFGVYFPVGSGKNNSTDIMLNLGYGSFKTRSTIDLNAQIFDLANDIQYKTRGSVSIFEPSMRLVFCPNIQKNLNRDLELILGVGIQYGDITQEREVLRSLPNQEQVISVMQFTSFSQTSTIRTADVQLGVGYRWTLEGNRYVSLRLERAFSRSEDIERNFELLSFNQSSKGQEIFNKSNWTMKLSYLLF